MKRGYILVEGQTEETFVRDVLHDHLVQAGLLLIPIILSTKRIKSGLKFRGGVASFKQVETEIRRLLMDRDVKVVTTMLDFYGLPEDFPRLALPDRHTCYDRVASFEEAFRRSIDSARFLPYLSLHEFEALLLSDAGAVGDVLQARAIETELGPIAASFASPEEIDDGASTHPAARILAIDKGYRKALHGPLAAARIGIATLREKCPHFGAWLRHLEDLAAR